METVRYVLSLFVVVFYPVGILLWVAIHPFSRFWRRLGTVKTYLILSVPSLLVMAALLYVRFKLLPGDYGSNYILVGAGIICILIGLKMTLQRRKFLTFSVLSGNPQLSGDQYPGKLLTEGPYARRRHPRYVEVFMWTLAYTLVANAFVSYLVFMLCLPLLFLVVTLEERELKGRFGKDYEEYCQRVPRFFPKKKTTPDQF